MKFKCQWGRFPLTQPLKGDKKNLYRCYQKRGEKINEKTYTGGLVTNVFAGGSNGNWDGSLFQFPKMQKKIYRRDIMIYIILILNIMKKEVNYVVFQCFNCKIFKFIS